MSTVEGVVLTQGVIATARNTAHPFWANQPRVRGQQSALYVQYQARPVLLGDVSNDRSVALKARGNIDGAIPKSMMDAYFNKIRLVPNPVLLEQLDVGYDTVDGYIAFSDSESNVSELWARGNRTVNPQERDYAVWSTYFDRPVSVTSQSQDFRLATPANALEFEQAEYKTGLKLLVLAGDGTVPVLTLLGPDTISLQPNDTYIEFGATAIDAVDGDLTADIVIDSSAVNMAVQGTYTVYYRVDDPNGNFDTATRTVIVVDNIRPVISLIGEALVVLEKDDSYVDAGATAYDLSDGDLTSSMTTFNDVDTSIERTYILTYNVTDATGNEAFEVRRVVRVGPLSVFVLSSCLNGLGDVVLKDKLTSDLVLRGKLNE
jgi:hypothetical protein